jgi:hypothetical protein
VRFGSRVRLFVGSDNFAGCEGRSPLCVRQQGTEQYGARQTGHLYFALLSPQTTHAMSPFMGERAAEPSDCHADSRLP